MAKKRNHNGVAGNGAAKPSEAKAAYFLSLTVENVRCFSEKQKLDLSDSNGRPRQWTILLGNNGTGKTTLLQLLAAHSGIYGDAPGGAYDGDNLFWHINGNATLLRTGSHRCVGVATMGIGPELSSVEGSFRILQTPWEFGKEGPLETEPRDDNQPMVCFGYGASRRLGFGSLPEPETETGFETLLSYYSNLRNGEEWLLRTDHAVLKYKHKGQEQALQHIKKLLLAVLPDEVTDVIFNPGEGVYPKPHVDFKTPDGWIPLRQLGYGYQTLIAWMIDFTSRMVERYPNSLDPLAEPAVVLVDELDLHLHPTWQRKLIDYLSKRFPNTQFIVTAHSPLIVQAAAGDANIALLRREGDHVVIDNDVGYIRGWSIDQLLTSDLFGLPSSRPPQFDAPIERRKQLLMKAKLTKEEKRELAELEKVVFSLPGGETAEQAKTSALILESIELLKKNQPQPQ